MRPGFAVGARPWRPIGGMKFPYCWETVYFPTPEICRAVAAATNTVCSGEILQTQRKKNFELSRAEYFKVLSMKTGELFALSCDLGAFLSGAHPGQRASLRQYGLALGTAYQVYDDCLDLF